MTRRGRGRRTRVETWSGPRREDDPTWIRERDERLAEAAREAERVRAARERWRAREAARKAARSN